MKIYTYIYYTAIRNKETLLFAPTWIDLEDIMLSEINQMEKGKYFVSLKCRGYRSQTQRQKVKWVLSGDGELVPAFDTDVCRTDTV